MVSIRCMVEECAYNSSLRCAAQKIRVRSSGTMHVDAPDATACESFTCRNDE